MPSIDDHPERPKMWRSWGHLLADAASAVRAGGLRLIGMIVLFQVLLLIIVAPLLGWLFREALRAGGMSALDLGSLHVGAGLWATLGLVILMCVLASWVTVLQYTLIVIALRRAHLGLPLSPRAMVRDSGRVARKLLRPSSLPLLGYLLVLVPLAGFGFASTLTRGLAVPPFVTGELMKQEVSAILLTAVMLGIVVLNIRFAIGVPLFVLTDAPGGRSLRLSWRITRTRTVVSLVGAVVTVLVAAGVITFGIAIAAIAPTAVVDDVAADAAPTVAAFALGAAQVLSLLLTSVVVAFISAITVAYLVRFRDRLPAGVQLHEPHTEGADQPGRPGSGQPLLGRRGVATVGVACAVVLAVVLGALAIPTMNRLSQHPDTLVLGHRGFSAGGVENTICGLEAAAAAGSDLVEMDVMQTADGAFVAMHDAQLSRLAGVDAQVKDLTLEEITALTVHAEGHQCAVPTFAEYVTRAAELELPLLIEIKLGGADTPDHVERLIAELESLGVLERNIYHSLDAASVATLKHARPDLTVGYTMAFAAVDVPDTPADFIVVEEWTATQEMQDAAESAGLGFMVWTVNSEVAMREFLRRDVDGIITDHPDRAIAERAEIEAGSGMADLLMDALTRFVVVF